MSYMKIKYLFGILIVIFFIVGCETKEEKQKFSYDDLKLDSIEWDLYCNDKCDEITECSGTFSYTFKRLKELKSDISWGKPCRLIVDEKPYEEIYQIQFKSNSAGFLPINVYEKHTINLCCSNYKEDFLKEDYDVCKEIILEPLCTSFEEEDINVQEKISEFCGDGICQESDGKYCLDCSIECKNSDYCNNKINIYCEDCSLNDDKLLRLTYEYQNTVYDCLTDFFSYHPDRIMTYNIKSEGNICEYESCEFVGSSSAVSVNEFGFVGNVEKGENRVSSSENLKAEIHETTHVFNYYAFGDKPSWFDEGVSIWTNTYANCHPKQLQESRISHPMNAPKKYELLKSGEMKIDEIKDSPHSIGSIFFVALGNDYNCDKNCVLTALKNIRKYRINCDDSCLSNIELPHREFYKEYHKENLMIPIVNNKLIRSEEHTSELQSH